METVCVKVVGGYLYDSFCGAGNGQFSCPTKTRPQDITPWYSHCLCQCLWGRKWSIFLPHKNSTLRYHPMLFTLFMTVFAGQETPQKLDRKPQNRAKTVNKRSKNTAICDTFATQHVRNAVFYNVFGPPSQKHWYLQCFVKTHAWNTVNTNEFKDHTFHGNKPQKAKTLIFTAFLRNDFSKKRVIFGQFLASEASQNKEGGYPPTPLPHHKF